MGAAGGVGHCRQRCVCAASLARLGPFRGHIDRPAEQTDSRSAAGYHPGYHPATSADGASLSFQIDDIPCSRRKNLMLGKLTILLAMTALTCTFAADKKRALKDLPPAV